MPIVNIDTTLDASGGDDTATESYQTNAHTATLQTEVSGATAAVDIHFEGRLADDLAWVDWVEPRTGVGAGHAELRGVDIRDLDDIRVRITNQDGSNTADVRAVVITGGG